MAHKAFLKQAIEEALAGLRAGAGGPFGAVIVKNGKIIGKGHNTVLKTHDPTAHAEMNAIRDACRNVGDHHLTGAIIYTNFEPCPMCLGAIYWARPDKVYYGSTQNHAADIGFDDAFIYEEIPLPYP